MYTVDKCTCKLKQRRSLLVVCAVSEDFSLSELKERKYLTF